VIRISMPLFTQLVIIGASFLAGAFAVLVHKWTNRR
jgi:hypothetical protein